MKIFKRFICPPDEPPAPRRVRRCTQRGPHPLFWVGSCRAATSTLGHDSGYHLKAAMLPWVGEALRLYSEQNSCVVFRLVCAFCVFNGLRWVQVVLTVANRCANKLSHVIQPGFLVCSTAHGLKDLRFKRVSELWTPEADFSKRRWISLGGFL